MPGARFSLCRYHPNGGDKVRGGSAAIMYHPSGEIAGGSMAGGFWRGTLSAR